MVWPHLLVVGGSQAKATCARKAVELWGEHKARPVCVWQETSGQISSVALVGGDETGLVDSCAAHSTVVLCDGMHLLLLGVWSLVIDSALTNDHLKSACAFLNHAQKLVLLSSAVLQRLSGSHC